MREFDFDKDTDILLVDDDQTLLKFFKIHLNKFFSNIVVVKNAKEALDLLKNKKFDLVISDIKMPREDGIQLMRKVRRHDHTIPFYLISGALLTDKQSETVESKADAFLEKPFELDHLHDFIMRGILMRQIYLELATIVTDPRKFSNLVRGKSFPKIADPSHRDRAKALKDSLADLHNSEMTLEQFLLKNRREAEPDATVDDRSRASGTKNSA